MLIHGGDPKALQRCSVALMRPGRIGPDPLNVCSNRTRGFFVMPQRIASDDAIVRHFADAMGSGEMCWPTCSETTEKWLIAD
jgi:hypothetical protein